MAVLFAESGTLASGAPESLAVFRNRGLPSARWLRSVNLNELSSHPRVSATVPS